MERPQWVPLRPGGETNHGMSNVVFPILKQCDEDRLEILGTGFFIAHFGLFLTAAHLFENPDVDFDRDHLLIPYLSFENRKNVMRRIVWISRHRTADIAVGLVEILHRLDSGAPVHDKSLLLINKTPNIGERVFSYGHPCSIVVPMAHNGDGAVIIQELSTAGIVREHFPNGRDRVMQPGCCIETDLESYGGSSGSPVADQYSRVFAVISSGLGENITYATPIEQILDTPIPPEFTNNANEVFYVKNCIPFFGMAPPSSRMV